MEKLAVKNTYAELHCISNFSFLKGASHPQELIVQAKELDYNAIALTDECSLSGVVKAHITAKKLHIKLIIGSEFRLSNGIKIIVIVPNIAGYRELSGFITLCRKRSAKGTYEAHFDDLRFRLQHCFIIWKAEHNISDKQGIANALKKAFKNRLWVGFSHQYTAGEQELFLQWQPIMEKFLLPGVACGSVLMHQKSRKPLHDTLTAIHENTSINQLGFRLQSNAEAYLKPITEIYTIFPKELIEETLFIAEKCSFSMDELRYQYPKELVPNNQRPIDYLTNLVQEGARHRWPQGTPEKACALIEKELSLIKELNYEYYFLTVYDIVQFARSQNILCQGRGSAANSVVCYCLHITEISPGLINVLFERFISKERNEPPDIDVDFEHQRREEVIQYIYQKYSRQRAALAATVITYRSRSAIRDVGKALGLDATLIDHLAKSLAWWDRSGDLMKRIEEAGLKSQSRALIHLFTLVEEILGFPRHLSQHVGGFVITHNKLSDIVPLENASMPDRTVIQWDKEDIEAMCLLKVDVLALGMLTALRKSLTYVNHYAPGIKTLADIPKEDKATYDMLSRGDSIGVFQVESRAQMSMLPRLKPQCFYDLVIEIAIVRPGPIQGDMVHPYLKRRDGLEPIHYENKALKEVLSSTFGIPIFQEQAIRLAMVAASFSAGEADQLRRAMASWGKNGSLLQFEKKFIQGMLNNGYSEDFANRVFSQIKGFGGYGFPESHSASFALLCYFSSWLKCHHPAAFYCALLNSQPMGFYSPSQLIQDARRHNIQVYPIDINRSDYDNSIEKNTLATTEHDRASWAIRLGLCRIKSLDHQTAKNIIASRGKTPFVSVDDLKQRTQLKQSDLQLLAAADALYSLTGHRYKAHWTASAAPHQSSSLTSLNHKQQYDKLTTSSPKMETDIFMDINSTGISLRPHPMVLLRQEYPFKRCKKQNELGNIGNGRFVQVAGLVTGRQRPGTAKGTLFLTLEDETGNMNIIVWKSTQVHFRKELLSAKLLLIKGRLETNNTVIHVIAGKLEDYSNRLQSLSIQSRDFH